MRKCYYWWAQPASVHEIKRGTRDQATLQNSLHMVRDGTAMVRLAASALRDLEYKGEIYNFSPTAFGFKSTSDFDPQRVLTADDLVVCTTRLALTENPGGKKKLTKTHLDFEREIHAGYKTLFDRCDRSFVMVSTPVARVMAERGFDCAYRAIRFEQTHGARYTGLKDTSDVLEIDHADRVECPRNVGYIAYLPRISASVAAGMIAVFSLDGTSTALWASLVANEYRDSFLEIASGPSPRLIIGEFTTTFPDYLPHLQSDVKFELDREKIIDVAVPRGEWED
jgi:hypothetical protein